MTELQENGGLTAFARELASGPPVKRPPPQCVICSRFVDVKTARRFVETGDFGTVLSVEFECARHWEALDG